MNKESIKKLIERRHPHYQEKLSHWNFLEDTYRGGRAWFEKHITKYLKEGETEFKERVGRAYRFNHTKEIVDLVNKYVFKAVVKRNEENAPASVQKFWQQATRSGLDIDQFSKLVSKNTSKFGRVWVVVDNNMPEGAVSVAEANQLGAATYAYIVKPQDMLDISFDEDGEIRWALVRERYRDDLDPFDSDGKEHYRYRLWMKDKYYLVTERKTDSDQTVYDEEEGVNYLGEVPIIPADHLINEGVDNYSTSALIGDVAYLDRACANYLSNLDAIIQDQTFSQLAIPAQGLLPGDEGHKKILEMGTKRIFTFDGENGEKPFFLSPDPKQAELIITTIRQIINEIYHSVGVAGERTKQDNSVGIDNSSGVAKAYDFDRVNSLLINKASALEMFELRLADMVAKWNGETITDEIIMYPRDYEARDLGHELGIANQMAMLQIPIELKRYQLKQIVSKLYPRLDNQNKAEIESAIENMEDQSIIEMPSFDSPTEEDSESSDSDG